MDKMTDSFEEVVRQADRDDEVAVVVEVVPTEDPGPEVTGAAFVAQRSAAFDEAIAPIIAAIGAAGGEVETAAWSLDSIYARIRCGQVPELLALDAVRMLDVPETFKLESRASPDGAHG